jgi:hypothetical protein
MKPFDPTRMQKPAAPLFDDAAAALLAVDSRMLNAH